MRLGLTYNDTLLKPQYSDIRSRSEVNIGNSLAGQYFPTPIISAADRDWETIDPQDCYQY